MSGAANNPDSRRVAIADVELDVIERGQGAPLLYLHGGAGIAGDHAFIDLLAQHRRVIAPSHPGFGTSSLPDWLDTVEDIAHIHLALLDRLGVATVDLVGMSLGGWIAADMASKNPERFPRVALIGPIGVKTGPSDKLDIPDIFAMPEAAVEKLRFHDPEKQKADINQMTDEQLIVMTRNNETLALLTWEPFMHDPKLKHRLHRVTAPVLLLRGVSDGIVSADYLARYARLFPNVSIKTIAEAGHAAQIEQPQATAKAILEFLQ